MGTGPEQTIDSSGDGTPGAGGRWVLAFQQLFDPHPSHVALLDLTGTVLAVNAAWRQYGRQNGLGGRATSPVGQNYLAVCEAGVAAAYPGAREAYVGLLDVLRNGRPKFTLTYPCHSPRQREWYRMWVEPQTPSVSAVIVAHQLIAAEPWDEAGGSPGAGAADAGPPPSPLSGRDGTIGRGHWGTGDRPHAAPPRRPFRRPPDAGPVGRRRPSGRPPPARRPPPPRREVEAAILSGQVAALLPAERRRQLGVRAQAGPQGGRQRGQRGQRPVGREDGPDRLRPDRRRRGRPLAPAVQGDRVAQARGHRRRLRPGLPVPGVAVDVRDARDPRPAAGRRRHAVQRVQHPGQGQVPVRVPDQPPGAEQRRPQLQPVRRAGHVGRRAAAAGVDRPQLLDAGRRPVGPRPAARRRVALQGQGEGHRPAHRHPGVHDRRRRRHAVHHPGLRPPRAVGPVQREREQRGHRQGPGLHGRPPGRLGAGERHLRLAQARVVLVLHPLRRRADRRRQRPEVHRRHRLVPVRGRLVRQAPGQGRLLAEADRHRQHGPGPAVPGPRPRPHPDQQGPVRRRRRPDRRQARPLERAAPGRGQRRPLVRPTERAGPELAGDQPPRGRRRPARCAVPVPGRQPGPAAGTRPEAEAQAVLRPGRHGPVQRRLRRRPRGHRVGVGQEPVRGLGHRPGQGRLPELRVPRPAGHQPGLLRAVPPGPVEAAAHDPRRSATASAS